jgi:hypothetical protein
MRRAAPVPLSATVLAARQEGLLSVRQCDEEGIDSDRRDRLVRSGVWTRPARGVVDTEPGLTRDYDARRRRAAWLAGLAYGPQGVVVGAGALALQGVAGLPASIPPEVSLGPRRGVVARPGIVVRYERTGAERRGAMRIAPLLDALVQAVPRLPRANAVAVLDDVAHRGLLGSGIDVGALVAARLVGRRGAVRARRWCGLVDGRSESPLETFARLDCIDGGVPPDELQVTIRAGDGLVVGRGDLGWRRRDGGWLLAEIDGRDIHADPTALYRDRAKQNDLVALGVDVLRFTGRDVAAAGTVAATVRRALGR